MDNLKEVARLTSLLEDSLQNICTADQRRQIMDDNSCELPKVLQVQLDGLIDQAAELRGLLKIGQAARRNEALSPAVISAALVMAEEICRALSELDDPDKA
ncbi:hypothetical protein CWR43_29930 [Rhizobium sullae]|uniref:Uncharacterized protein n=1 Tax=Rhizobium sullae TaxID=50338 RepID=A0A2N0D1A5_RHISU|nr:hypothetical protein [Rhizobium sullae]PKA39900.1 hypothetical protein CWR43_29930 [Rhizobium sullae]